MLSHYPVISLFVVTSSSTQFSIALYTEVIFSFILFDFICTVNIVYLNYSLKDILDMQDNGTSF